MDSMSKNPSSRPTGDNIRAPVQRSLSNGLCRPGHDQTLIASTKHLVSCVPGTQAFSLPRPTPHFPSPPPELASLLGKALAHPMGIGRRGRSKCPAAAAHKTCHQDGTFFRARIVLSILVSHFCQPTCQPASQPTSSPAGRGPPLANRVQSLYQKLGPLPTRPVSALACR